MDKGYVYREIEEYCGLRDMEMMPLKITPAVSKVMVRYPQGWYKLTVPASIVNVTGFIKMWEVRNELRKNL